MTDQPYAFVDHARLVGDLKRDDPRAIAYAYAQVFGSHMGRLVLTHQLAEAGVGKVRGPGLSPEDSRYHDGRADQALQLLNRAGFGDVSAAHAVAADILEGQDHDRHDADDGHHRFGGPDHHPIYPD